MDARVKPAHDARRVQDTRIAIGAPTMLSRESESERVAGASRKIPLNTFGQYIRRCVKHFTHPHPGPL
jgi:hypothetical protein